MATKLIGEAERLTKAGKGGKLYDDQNYEHRMYQHLIKNRD